MATIPSADELGIRSPSVVSKGADLGGVKGASSKATRMDLKSVQTTAAQQGLAEWEDRISNEELAKAETQFQLGVMAEAEKMRNDTDLETIEERHAAAMQDQLGKASAQITSAKNRAMFIERAELGVGKANAVMTEKVTARKNDKEKAHSATAIDLLVRKGMDLEYGDPGESALAIELQLSSMAERNVITDVEAQSLGKKAMLDMAYGRLKSMDPKQQLAVLNDENAKWVEHVPPDVLKSLKDQAEDQDMNNQALAKAFEMQNMEEEAGLAELERQFVAGEIDDQEYEKARLRFQRVKNDQEVGKQKILDDYFEEGMAEIYSGSTTIKQLEDAPGGIEMMKNLSPSQRANMFAAEDEAMQRAAGKGRKYSDFAVVAQLQEYMANDQPVKGRKYWSENYARLNMADFKYFNVATSPTKSTAPEWKPTRTARQLLTEYKKENSSMTDQDSSDIWDRIDEKSKRHFDENNGKEAPDEVVNGWIDEEFLKLRHKKNWWPDEEKFLWEMDDTPGGERDQVVANIDFVQKATGMSRAQTGALMSAYSQDMYDFMPTMTEALGVVRRNYPNEKSYQHWARIKNMMKIDKPPTGQVLGQEQLDMGSGA